MCGSAVVTAAAVVSARTIAATATVAVRLLKPSGGAGAAALVTVLLQSTTAVVSVVVASAAISVPPAFCSASSLAFSWYATMCYHCGLTDCCSWRGPAYGTSCTHDSILVSTLHTTHELHTGLLHVSNDTESACYHTVQLYSERT
jgi:hypothetical protein